ncbi:Multidrug resistance protein MdtE precursor [Achromobacter xylosoxidans]|nr:Multidrug resistance protein MdtE precursor [Achromobacter xylosoxidans]
MVSRNRIAVLVVFAAVIAAGGGYALFRAPAGANAAQAQGAPAATPVEVAEVVSKTIVDWQRYSGRLEAIDRVDIRPLVSGTLTAVHFQDGSIVKKGDVLFTIDPRPYAAEVDRAAAALTAAKARASYTATELARGQRLLADNAIARRDFEEKQNAAREAAANLQGAQAALDYAKLNLGYTRIEAPVAGRVSRAEVTVGNVVAAGAASVPLTTLVSVSKMYASFDVDEQTFLKYVNPARNGKAGSVPVELGLANEILWSGSSFFQVQPPRIEGLPGAPDPVGNTQQLARNHHQRCRRGQPTGPEHGVVILEVIRAGCRTGRVVQQRPGGLVALFAQASPANFAARLVGPRI